jgi:nucleoside-diphosphate-sugar epimerase
MPNDKILIIGKNSFLGKNLYHYIKKKKNVRLLSYKKFLKLNNKEIKNFNYLCNCSINPKYNTSKYDEKNDIDLKIVKRIQNYKINFIFLSSRKVYFNKNNITENDKLSPRCDYSKNKLLTEKKILKLIPNKITVLRISNVIGLKADNKRKVHSSFIDNYIKYIFSIKKIYYINDYKDFITIKQFVRIFYNIIKKKLSGTYNVSLGKKIYINEILKWLNYKNANNNKFLIKKNCHYKDSFTLNNKKLLNLIKIKINKSEVKNFCKTIGKKIYYRSNYLM